MDIIKTGLGIKKTIQNVARLREIVSTFARNGFDELLIQSGIHARIPNFVIPASKNRIKVELNELKDEAYRDWVKSLGYRIRKSFEELGPSFIKLGQLLGTREDLFHEDFIDEMKLLRDKVKGIAWEDAKKVIEKSLGRSIDEVFSSFESQPIGTASIGIVYKATLLDGSDVVVKVKRPNILNNIRTDFDILILLIEAIEKVSPDVRYLGLHKLVTEFRSSLESELDFQIEALNNQRFAKVVKKYDDKKLFYIPKVYQDYLTSDVIVMEQIKGIPFSDSSKVNEIKDAIGEKLAKSLAVFLNTILQDGFFHADLHGGNFFLMPDHKIGIIDFGLMGSLGKRNRSNFVAIVYSIINHDYDNVVYEFLDVADYESIPDVDHVISDVREKLAPFIGLTVQQINMSHLFREIVSVMTKHKLFLPREWFIVFRALTTLDGVGKSLDMDFDLFNIMDDEMGALLDKFISKDELMEEAAWMGRDLLSTFRVVPRHVKWFLRDFSKKGYSLEVINRGYESELCKLSHGLFFIGLCLLCGILILCGIMLGDQSSFSKIHTIPVGSWIFWGVALILFFRASWLWPKRRD